MLLLAALLGAASLASALAPPNTPATSKPAPTAPPAAASKQALNDRWLAAFHRRDWPAAEAALSRLCELDPDSFVPWYNLACVYALSDRAPLATAALERAVALGFVDFHQLRRDEHLAPIRGTVTYAALIEGWRTIQDATIDARLARARKALGPRYSFARDPARRTLFASAFPESSVADARAELDAICTWWSENVQPVTTDSPDPRPDPCPDAWVLVILPTLADFNAWAARNFADTSSPTSAPPLRGTVGGIYDHDKKELVAMDLGATLRHEFAHVLHWRAMARAGHTQPVWIQEGLCSLMETVDFAPDGRLSPAPCWRTNMAANAARAAILPKWDTLFAKDADKFVQAKPLANYAVARSIMLFLHQQGKLRDWYAAYTANFDKDPTGAKAIEQVFARPLPDVERQFRRWLLDLPRAPDHTSPSPSALPFDVLPAGDGLALAQSDPAALARSAPSRGGLLPGDVITRINARPTRDLHDLARALAGTKPGDRATVAFRRGLALKTADVTLLKPD